MSDFITRPKHGDSGWCGGELYIYNGIYGLPGWLKLDQYQKLKSVLTGKCDWRVSEVPGEWKRSLRSGFCDAPRIFSF
jgi:hypothetical protein